MESDEEEEDTAAHTIPSEELNLVVRELTLRLENLKTCYDLITKHGQALQRALSELETGDDLANKTKIVSERATLFRISSNAMINVSCQSQQDVRKECSIYCSTFVHQACSDYLQTAQTQGHKWSKMLQHERDQKLHLEEMVEQLARQHSHLEQAAHRHRPSECLFFLPSLLENRRELWNVVACDWWLSWCTIDVFNCCSWIYNQTSLVCDELILISHLFSIREKVWQYSRDICYI